MGWKDAYQQKSALVFARWQANVEDLKRAQDGLAGPQHEEAARRMSNLEALLQNVQQRLTELKHSDPAHWEFHRQAVERAMINFKRILDGAHPTAVQHRARGAENAPVIFEPSGKE